MKQFYWIAPFLSFIAGYFFISHYFSAPTVKVPYLIGKQVHNAISLLSQHMLAARIIGEKEDNNVAPGTIVQQKPAPYTEIRPAQPILLIVSKVSQPLKTPEVVGLPVDEQVVRLQKAGFHVQVCDLESALPQGVCLAQWPCPGAEIKSQGKMILYRAIQKKELYVMPSFQGKSSTYVQELCEKYGLECQVIHAQQPSSWHRCYDCGVLDQRPFAGTLLPIGSGKKIVIQIQV